MRRLGLAAVCADLLGLGHIVLDADLRQSFVIRPARSPRLRGRGRCTSRQLQGHRDVPEYIDLEEVPLPGGLDQPLPPRAEDVAAVELELPPQFLDGALVLLGGLIMELRGLVDAARRSSTC